MRSLILIIPCLFIASTSSQQTQLITCNFGIYFKNIYECYVNAANVTSATATIQFNGTHTLGRFNRDVRSLTTPYIERAGIEIHYLNPHILEEFPNIETIQLYDTGFKGLSLENCEKLKQFDVYYSDMAEIPSGVFGNCSNMERMAFNYGRIERTFGDSFRGLTGLRYLSLRQHKHIEIFNDSLVDSANLTTFIFSGNGSIEANALRHLTGLEIVELSNYRADFQHFEELLNGLTALRTIDLTRNSMSTVNFQYFTQFRGLFQLRLDHNQLTTIAAGSFDNYDALTHLTLDSNHITSLAADSFRGLARLSDLWLADNFISDLSALPFAPLANLTYLDFSSNRMPALPSGLFAQNTNLTTVRLNNCGLRAIGPGVFNSLERLGYLSLGINRLSAIPADTFVNLPALWYLSLDANNITRLNSNGFDGMNNLTLLYVRENRIDAIEPNFFGKFPSIITFLGDGNECINRTVRNMAAGNYDEWFETCWYNWEYGRTSTVATTSEMTTAPGSGSSLRAGLAAMVVFLCFLKVF